MGTSYHPIERTAGPSSRMRHQLKFHDLITAPTNAARVTALPQAIEWETNNRLDMLSTIITTMAAQARSQIAHP